MARPTIPLFMLVKRASFFSPFSIRSRRSDAFALREGLRASERERATLDTEPASTAALVEFPAWAGSALSEPISGIAETTPRAPDKCSAAAAADDVGGSSLRPPDADGRSSAESSAKVFRTSRQNMRRRGIVKL